MHSIFHVSVTLRHLPILLQPFAQTFREQDVLIDDLIEVD